MSHPLTNRLGLTKRLAGLRCDARGVAAVEFAIIVPILLVLFSGVYEASELVRTKIKLTHAANALAKMVTQQPTAVTWGTTGTVGDICSGAATMMTPQVASGVGASVSSVTKTTSGTTTTVTQDWETHSSCPTAAPALSATDAKAMVSSYALAPNSTDSVIIVKAYYTYRPVLSYVLGSSFSLTATSMARPRSGTTIACTNC